jgi:hypothetical protein
MHYSVRKAEHLMPFERTHRLSLRALLNKETGHVMPFESTHRLSLRALVNKESRRCDAL